MTDRNMKLSLCAFSLAFPLSMPVLACSETHVVEAGDSVFSIAETRFGSAAQWNEIAALNTALAKGRLDLKAGQVLQLPCPDEIVARAAGPELFEQGSSGIRIVTGTDFAPFTDLDWPAQGMLTEIVTAAFDHMPDDLPYEITWENDWSQHLYPLVDETKVDMSFPWFRPDCATMPDHGRCVDFHFSEPLVNLVILLFARADDPIKFEEDRDLVGRTLCRPAGYFTHDLERPDRRWLSQGLIDLRRPDTPEGCFELLIRGEVDAVAMNEFQGMQTLAEMGLEADVAPLKQPLSEEALHVVISKKHWRGTTHMYRFDAGLRTLKQTAEYSEIVNRHLAHFWETIEKK